MKIVFLDFDGVLNHAGMLMGRTALWKDEDEFDPHNVGCLNHLLEVSGAKIVVSSSWRKIMKYEELVALLARVGVRGEVIGKTPHYVKNMGIYGTHEGHGGGWSPRGAEIQEWLDEHPEVTHFVILDDSDDMLHLTPKLVLTSFEVGLLKEDVEKALLILEEPR